jgi:hypothetical protein
MAVIVNILIMLLLIASFVFWTRSKWKNIRPLIYDDDSLEKRKNDITETHEGVSEKMSKTKWKKRFDSTIFHALKKLETINSKETQAASRLINRINKDFSHPLNEKLYDLIIKILEEGTLQSILLALEDAFIYILVFPGLHDHFALLKRYTAFTRGLIHHMEELRKALPENRTNDDLGILMFFLSPNLEEGSMHFAFQNSDIRLLPKDLLDNVEVNKPGDTLYDSREIF